MNRRIGLIGDVHAEDQRLSAAINALEAAGCDLLLCIGDLCDGPGDLARCVELLQLHDVKCVRGNHDRWLLQDRARHIEHAHQRDNVPTHIIAFLEQLPLQYTVTTPAGELLLCHGLPNDDLAKIWPGSERMPPDRHARLDQLVSEGNYRVLINGHMHYRVVLDFPGLTHILAGTLSPRHRPGISFLDFDANAIQVLEFDTEPGDGSALRATCTTALFDSNRHQWPDTQAFDAKVPPLVLYE